MILDSKFTSIPPAFAVKTFPEDASSMNPVNFGGGDTNQPAHPKDKYKWHTVVDGFSKLINYLIYWT